MNGLVRIAVAAIVGLTLLAGGYYGYRTWWPRPSTPIEISVLFPGTSEKGWPKFVQAIHRVAAEKGMAWQDNPGRYECLVDGHPQPVMFKWYHEVGIHGMQYRLSELCERSIPPLAVVGPNNSPLMRKAVHQLAAARSERKETTPVLLMTAATCDELTRTMPDRTFRFGFRNTYQARTVVERLRKHWLDLRVKQPPQISAVLVTVNDNSCALDLAQRVGDELIRVFGAQSVKVTREAFDANAGADDLVGPPENLARSIVHRMTDEYDRYWVVVLPLGATVFQRVTAAIHEACFQSLDHRPRQARDKLTLLCGDSVDYADFTENRPGRILPEKVPGPTIFFAHGNPLEETDDRGDGNGSRVSAEEALDGDLVRAMLATLPRLGMSPTPATLARELDGYREPGSADLFFDRGERRAGGGALVATPKLPERSFTVWLPGPWQPPDPNIIRSGAAAAQAP